MMNHISLKEWISSKPLRVEFHDMDEIIKDDIKKNQEIIDVSVKNLIQGIDKRRK
jgi:hypothetical protein